MATTIEDFRRFSVHDLKRLGMLRNGYNGWLKWSDNEGGGSTIVLTVELSGDNPAVLLQYTMTHTGERVNDLVKLRFQKSNLPGHNRGFWVFVCPVTGNPCRMLYLDSGHFKSRKALPPGTIYKCQAYRGSLQNIARTFDYYDAIATLDGTLQKPYGKTSYRGKPTRTVKRLMRKEGRLERAYRGVISER